MEEAKNKRTDWELVERDYRAGILSLREMGDAHGISEGAIRKRAKRDGWERDLAERIREKAESLVRSDAVRNEVRNESAYSEREVVEANAELQASIVRAHRKDIQRNRSLAAAMLAELEAQTGSMELYERLGELLHAPDDKGVDKLNELYRKIIALPSRVDSAKKLADTLKTLVGLERQAFNIDGARDEETSKPQDDAASMQEVARRLAFVLASGISQQGDD